MTRIGVFGWGIVAPRSPNVETFARNLEGAFDLVRIGDAVSSRNIHAAVYDGLRYLTLA